MASIKGDISVMPLSDLLQWINLCRKTGTITVSFQSIEKKIYLESGKIVFISSNKEGERLGEFIIKNSYQEMDKIKVALIQSQLKKIPFTQMLIDMKYFTQDQLIQIIATYAQELLIDALSWNDGWFEFIQDVIPQYVMEGPIKLQPIEIIMKVFKYLDEVAIQKKEKTRTDSAS